MVPNKKVPLLSCLFFSSIFLISNFASSKSKPPRFDLANKLVEEKEMKNDKKIDVRMYEVENDKAAFVEVSVIDVDAKEHVGLFLVDSGCTSNKLSTSIKMMVGDKCQLIRTLKTQTVGNQIVEEEVFSFPFTIGAFMQMPSSPQSMVLFTISTLLH